MVKMKGIKNFSRVGIFIILSVLISCYIAIFFAIIDSFLFHFPYWLSLDSPESYFLVIILFLWGTNVRVGFIENIIVNKNKYNNFKIWFQKVNGD